MEAEKFADQVRVDSGGNSYATVNGEGKPRIMFAGHIDEIGVMVTHIDDEGFVFFDTIGGWDSQVFVGQRVLLIGHAGMVSGVIGKKAIHLMEKEDRDKVSKTTDLWIDIGAATKAEANTRIRIGDAGVLAAGVQEYPGGRLVSRSLDNRIGAFVVLEALRLLSRQRPGASVTAVATAQEEIAYTGGGAVWPGEPGPGAPFGHPRSPVYQAWRERRRTVYSAPWGPWRHPPSGCTGGMKSRWKRSRKWFPGSS